VVHFKSKYGRTPEKKLSARYKLIAKARRLREIIKPEIGTPMVLMLPG